VVQEMMATLTRLSSEPQLAAPAAFRR